MTKETILSDLIEPVSVTKASEITDNEILPAWIERVGFR
jgi:hypothetical protein